MKKTILFLLVFCAFNSYAQSKKQILESLKMTSHPLDMDADYSYLVNTSSIQYNIPSNWDIDVYNSFNKTIKIYNDNGLSMANVVIPLWRSKRDRELLQKIKVRLHKLVNGNLVSEEVKIEKYIEENENVILYKFSVPNVSVVDVIEMKYLISSPYVTILPRFYFQHEVPVDSAQYTIDVPGYFSFAPNLKGYLDIDVTDKKLPLSDHYEMRYMLKANNISPIKNPPYVMDVDDYRSSIKYEMVSHQIPGRGKTKLSSTWKVVGDYFWHDWKIKKAVGYSYDKLKIEEDFSATTDTINKIKSIVDYVHQNYTWNNEYLTSKPNIKELLKIKSGNAIDINTLLTNILCNNGIDASILLTRLRSHGYINDAFPSRGNFNNALTHVKVGNGYIVIDPTDKHLDLGQIALKSRNFSGLLITEDKDAEFIHFDTKNIYKKTTQAEYTIKEDKTLSVYKKEKLANSAKSDYIENQNNYLPKNAELVNPVSIKRNDRLNIEYNYTIEEPLMQLEGKLIIPSCVDCPIKLLSLDQKDRDYPLIIPSKTKQTYVYQLNIPKGWKVESKPEDAVIKNHNQMAEMTYTIKESGDKLVLSILYEIKKELFEPKEYKLLRYAINKMKDKLEESIVLVQI